LGHDPKVCLQHYVQTTDEHFERASGGAKSGVVGGENDPPTAQKAAQQVAAAPGTESQESLQC
jgi:hypothetical protein